MAKFSWKGRNRGGQVLEGVELADSRDAAVAALRRRQIQVSSIREQGRQIPIMKRLKLPTRVPQKRLALFTRQFSVMLDAGLPLVQCLEILGEQEENR
ncbi:MAG: type II secretion system F family protein, partial [Acidobacteria bacterium]|nr:type II secretion system F family protein [Acidobacteriota bacterium]